jgi:type IV secretion system protein TrbL
MATPNAGVLDTVLNTFRTQIDSSFGVLQGPVTGTLGSLIVISVVLMALFWAIDEGGSIWGPLFRKILVVGWWSYLILNWQSLALAVYTAFGALGAQAGGAGGLSGFLNYPSSVVHLGITNAQVLLDLAAYYAGQTNQWGTPPIANTGLDLMAAFKVFLGSLINIVEALACALLVFIAYFWLALEIVVTTIEFHIVLLMGFCALPFGVLDRTSTYAERVLSYVISAGFKVMALGIVIGLGQNFLTTYQLTYTPGVLPGLDQMAGLALGILVVLMLAISAPKYAQAIISGGTSTGVGSLAGAAGIAVGTGLVIAGGAKVAIGALSGLAGVASGASRAAAAAAAKNLASSAGDATKAASNGAGSAPETDTANLAANLRRSGGDAPPRGGAADGLARTVTPFARPQSRPDRSFGRRMSDLAAGVRGVGGDSDGPVAAPPPPPPSEDDPKAS